MFHTKDNTKVTAKEDRHYVITEYRASNYSRSYFKLKHAGVCSHPCSHKQKAYILETVLLCLSVTAQVTLHLAASGKSCWKHCLGLSFSCGFLKANKKVNEMPGLYLGLGVRLSCETMGSYLLGHHPFPWVVEMETPCGDCLSGDTCKDDKMGKPSPISVQASILSHAPDSNWAFLCFQRRK